MWVAIGQIVKLEGYNDISECLVCPTKELDLNPTNNGKGRY